MPNVAHQRPELCEGSAGCAGSTLFLHIGIHISMRITVVKKNTLKLFGEMKIPKNVSISAVAMPIKNGTNAKNGNLNRGTTNQRAPSDTASGIEY